MDGTLSSTVTNLGTLDNAVGTVEYTMEEYKMYLQMIITTSSLIKVEIKLLRGL